MELTLLKSMAAARVLRPAIDRTTTQKRGNHFGETNPSGVDQEGMVVGVRLRQGFGGHPPREVSPAEALA
jgi:hypothetical protein